MTTRVNQELRALATLAHDAGVTADLNRMSTRELWSRCSGAHTPFWTAVRDFLARHGHRETDFDAYHPTWWEAPWIVLDHVRALLAGPASAPSRPSKPNDDLQLQIIQRLPVEMRGLAARVIALAREYTVLDDLEHYHTTRLSLPLRRGVRAIGRHLCARGVVADELDAFFARAGSLRDAIAQPSRMDALRREIATNKAEYLHAQASTPRWSLAGEADDAPRIPEDENVLRGIPGSPGEAEGHVHIVRSGDDFPDFPPGAVLVARTTNPAWTPLFYSAAAVVTESGGPLSHGAVTAREMRIPAVMSVRGVLDRVQNGDRVRVNGASGTVLVMPARAMPPR
jgi:pyruvate,water dikinase